MCISNTVEMSFSPSIIATLATGPAIQDLRIFLASLEIFNVNPPTVYVYCDTDSADAIAGMTYKGVLHHKVCLDRYAKLSRSDMEGAKGVKFKNLWFDFMTEKINLLRWVFSKDPEAKNKGVMFCDADICFFGPLPEIPVGARVALSPHDIRPEDERKYGRYNGGYLWISEAQYADIWWNACADARFYEQSALEDLAANVKEHPAWLYEFPVTENYGWWRLWQGSKSAEVLMSEWGMNRNKGGSGITIRGARLGSIHTHMHEKKDGATMVFNGFVVGYLRKLADRHIPAKRLMAALKN